MSVSSCDSVEAVVASNDPRVCDQFVNVVRPAGDAAKTVLVGTVHDHPASVYRARAVVEAVSPDVIAVEVPPLAAAVFRERAGEDSDVPGFSGEMAAAVDAADSAQVAGIDSFGPSFLGSLLTEAYERGTSVSTLSDVVADLARVQREATLCRAAATFERLTPTVEAAVSSFEHDVTATDPPADQARDERDHVARAVSLHDAVETPPAESLLDSTREENMSARVSSLRDDGVVVAVVGYDHLAPITQHLTAA